MNGHQRRPARPPAEHRSKTHAAGDSSNAPPVDEVLGEVVLGTNPKGTRKRKVVDTCVASSAARRKLSRFAGRPVTQNSLEMTKNYLSSVVKVVSSCLKSILYFRPPSPSGNGGGRWTWLLMNSKQEAATPQQPPECCAIEWPGLPEVPTQPQSSSMGSGTTPVTQSMAAKPMTRSASRAGGRKTSAARQWMRRRDPNWNPPLVIRPPSPTKALTLPAVMPAPASRIQAVVTTGHAEANTSLKAHPQTHPEVQPSLQALQSTAQSVYSPSRQGLGSGRRIRMQKDRSPLLSPLPRRVPLKLTSRKELRARRALDLGIQETETEGTLAAAAKGIPVPLLSAPTESPTTPPLHGPVADLATVQQAAKPNITDGAGQMCDAGSQARPVAETRESPPSDVSVQQSSAPVLLVASNSPNWHERNVAPASSPMSAPLLPVASHQVHDDLGKTSVGKAAAVATLALPKSTGQTPLHSAQGSNTMPVSSPAPQSCTADGDLPAITPDNGKARKRRVSFRLPAAPVVDVPSKGIEVAARPALPGRAMPLSPGPASRPIPQLLLFTPPPPAPHVARLRNNAAAAAHDGVLTTLTVRGISPPRPAPPSLLTPEKDSGVELQPPIGLGDGAGVGDLSFPFIASRASWVNGGFGRAPDDVSIPRSTVKHKRRAQGAVAEPTADVRQRFREAYVNQKLAHGWSAGEVWAGCDFQGLELSLETCRLHHGTYHQASERLAEECGQDAAHDFVRHVHKEWLQLKELRRASLARTLHLPAGNPQAAQVGSQSMPRTPRSILKRSGRPAPRFDAAAAPCQQVGLAAEACGVTARVELVPGSPGLETSKAAVPAIG